MVCQPKECGGLGVIDLRTQGDAVLLIYLHKFYNRWDVPWVQLIWDTYYPNRIPHASDMCGSFWWRDVMMHSDIFRGITSVEVGNGSSPLFWKDLWLGGVDHPLMLSFPRAFSFSTMEEA